MSKLKLATAISIVLVSMQTAYAADIYTPDATVTLEDNTAVACKAVNVSKTKQKVFAELINDEGKILSTTENPATKVKDTIILEPGASHIVLANAGAGTLTARCHFNLDTNKVRAGLGIYKNRGNGSLELYMEAR